MALTFFLSLKSSNIVGDHYNDCQTIQEFFSSRIVHCYPVNKIPEILKCDHWKVRVVSVSAYEMKFGNSLLFLKINHEKPKTETGGFKYDYVTSR